MRTPQATLILTLPLLAAMTAQARRPIPEPLLPPGEYPLYYHAAGRTVEVLGQMIRLARTDGDVLLQEQLIADLGRTGHRDALPLLQVALADDWRIAATAARSLGNWPLPWVEPLLASALVHADNRVALEAVRMAGRLGFAGDPRAIKSLTTRGDPILSAAAIDVLTGMGVPLAQPNLLVALRSPELVVRLAAARHASLIEQPDAELLTDLAGLAGGQNPLVRAEALVSLARLQGAAARQVLLSAADSPDWRVRAAAARALGCIGPTPALLELLEDDSAPVRLAAAEGAAQAKDHAAAEKLWAIFEEPVLANHRAACAALAAIGTDAVAVEAARRLGACGSVVRAAGTDGEPPPLSPLWLTRRNLAGACFILGRMGSREGLEEQLRTLKALAVWDELAIPIVESLGHLRDGRIMPALLAYLAAQHKQAEQYFRISMSPMGNPAPFSEPAFAAALKTVVMLAEPETMNQVAAVLRFQVSNQRLMLASTAAMEALPRLVEVGLTDQADAVRLARGVLSEPMYGQPARWHAAHLLGRYRADSGIEALRAVLTVERPDWPLMNVAAWAMQEITGVTPDIGAPRTREPALFTVSLQ